jgi:hypothetical protein
MGQNTSIGQFMSQTEIQLKTRSKIITTKQGFALTFGFKLGPISVFVIANLPEDKGDVDKPLVYIKINLRISEEWQYSTEF